jgi:hypothetical protein
VTASLLATAAEPHREAPHHNNLACLKQYHCRRRDCHAR